MSWYADDVVKVEVRFDGSAWVDVSDYLYLSKSMGMVLQFIEVGMEPAKKITRPGDHGCR